MFCVTVKLGVSMLPSTTPSMVPPPGATSTFPPQETPSPADDKVFEEVPQEVGNNIISLNSTALRKAKILFNGLTVLHSERLKLHIML